MAKWAKDAMHTNLVKVAKWAKDALTYPATPPGWWKNANDGWVYKDGTVSPMGWKDDEEEEEKELAKDDKPLMCLYSDKEHAAPDCELHAFGTAYFKVQKRKYRYLCNLCPKHFL